MWKKKVLSTERSQAVSMVFKKISQLLKKINLEKEKHETPIGYAVRVMEASGLDLTEFVDNFNRCKYGGLVPDEKAVLSALEKYDEARQIVKKKIGSLKALII